MEPGDLDELRNLRVEGMWRCSTPLNIPLHQNCFSSLGKLLLFDTAARKQVLSWYIEFSNGGLHFYNDNRAKNCLSTLYMYVASSSRIYDV